MPQKISYGRGSSTRLARVGEPARPQGKRKSRGAPIRYSARTYVGSKIVEIAIGTDLTRVLACARRHHERTGRPVWGWNVRTGESVFEVGEVAIQAACA
jgi:hypothetical protein